MQDELISRQAVVGYLCTHCPDDAECFEDCDDIKNIKALSSVNPKTGHWITVTNGRGGHECSLCHEYAPSYQNGDEWLTNYCPNCGTKMVEPQESEK